MSKRTAKKKPTHVSQIWFKDKNLPTKDELIKFTQELDKQYPGDTHNRGFVRAKLQELIAVTDPWEKLGMNWAEFKRQCGFSSSRATTKMINQASKHASVDQLRSASEERLSWGDIYTKPENGHRYKTIMGAGDFHDIEVDEFAFRMFIEKLRVSKPDVISIHGDMFDAPEFSKHFQDPREYELQTRIQKVHDMLGEMRDACPNSQIDLIEGNHEARISRHILEMSPATADILDHFHGMGIRELLGLDRFEVNYIAKGDLYAFTDAQMKRSVMESERIYWNTVWVRHHPPKMTNVTMPGFHGHHHSHQVTTYMNPLFGGFEWHQLGAMHRRQASYTDGRKWNLGFIFGVVDTDMQRVSFDYTHVGDTCCQMGGKFYERNPDEYYPALVADLENRLNNASKSPSIMSK